MKKFLITISPFCVILFIIMWISCGLKEAFVFLGIIPFIIAMVILINKWFKFVDKYVKD